MSAPAIFETIRCHWCSRQQPRFQAHRLASGQAICDYCLEWHYHALDFLGGAMPKGCQECGVAWAVLRDQTPGDEVRMYVVPKDGIYQVLCSACVRPYTRQRPDLYQGTKFGRESLKL